MWRTYPREVGTLTPPIIHGTCDPAFSEVKRAFSHNFIEHGEIGASVSIEVDGRRVVDLWGGFADPSRLRPWSPDQLVNVFSIGKGVTALVAAQCVARGEFSYDTVVAHVWPEFASHGKDSVTVRDILGHRGALPAVRHQLPMFAMYDWRAMTEALAEERPWWPLVGDHGYHVNTFGFLIGEVIRRTTGASVGQLIRERISAPLNVDIHLGCDSSLHPRMADFEWPGNPIPDDPPTGLTEDQLLQYNTYYNPPGLSGSGTVNTAEWRMAEIPSTNMHATARGVAQMYSSLVRDETLLPHTVLDLAVSEVSCGDDLVLGRVSRFAHGFQIPLPERNFGPIEQSFGHYGAGGSVGFADPVNKVGFGYVMNQMGPRWQNPRNRALIEALYSSL